MVSPASAQRNIPNSRRQQQVRNYRLLTEGRNAEVVYRVNRMIVDMLHGCGSATTASAHLTGGGPAGASVADKAAGAEHAHAAAEAAADSAVASSGAASAAAVAASGSTPPPAKAKARPPLWVHASPMKIVMRAWAWCPDRVHLSPQGYREFAKWLRDPVVDAMLQVELDWWHDSLSIGLTRGARKL